MENQILNKLLRIVEDTDPREFLKASKCRGISKHMRFAMEQLALECLEKSCNSRSLDFNTRIRPTPQKSHLLRRNNIFSPNKAAITSEIDQIYEILINSKKLLNKTAMIDFAEYVGIQVSLDKKDSRVRAAKKLAKAIVFSPERIKEKSLSILKDMMGDQTQGWFDIILKK
jgi:hypothetical protein